MSEKSLGDRSRQSLVWKIVSTFSQHGLGLISSLFLARLLEPSDFGLVAMALGFINIFRLLISFGHSSALIQDTETSEETYSSVFFFNIILGLLLCLIFQFSAPLIAKFYSDFRVTDLIRILSTSLIFYSLSLIHQARWMKYLDFKKIAIQDISAEILGFFVGLIAAFSGCGVYSLVYQNLTAAFSRTLICWIQSDWHPKFIFSISELKRLFPTGISVFLSQSLDVVIRRWSIIVVGKFFGATVLGLFSRADSLSNLVVTYTGQPLKTIAFPFLSAIQKNSEQSKIILCKFLHIIAFLSFGLVTILFLSAEDVIHVLFGAKWIGAIAIFQLLVLQAPVFSSDQLISFSFLAKGRSRDYLYFDILKKVILVLPVFFVFKYSFFTFLTAMITATSLVWILNYSLVLGRLGIDKRDRLKTSLPYFLTALTSVKLATFLLGSFSSILMGLAGGLFYLFGNILFNSEGFQLSLKELKLFVKARAR